MSVQCRARQLPLRPDLPTVATVCTAEVAQPAPHTSPTLAKIPVPDSAPAPHTSPTLAKIPIPDSAPTPDHSSTLVQIPRSVFVIQFFQLGPF